MPPSARSPDNRQTLTTHVSDRPPGTQFPDDTALREEAADPRTSEASPHPPAAANAENSGEIHTDPAGRLQSHPGCGYRNPGWLQDRELPPGAERRIPFDVPQPDESLHTVISESLLPQELLHLEHPRLSLIHI